MLPVKSVLFVCLGNICRSPTAEAVFKKRAADAGLIVRIDSAGTGAWHQGELPDERARRYGSKRGYDFTGQFARKVENNDFGNFDYILAMDKRNRDDLMAVCPADFRSRIRLFLDYAPGASTSEVPDPYYGGDNGFETVLDLVEAASDGLITALQAAYHQV